MYEFLDRPMTSLDHEGRFLVWAMRSWVKAASAKQCPARTIAPAFSSYGMLSGLHPFLHMMAIFNRHALENLVFCSPCCARVSEHEAIILGLVNGQANGLARSVPGTLELLIEDDHVADLLIALGRLSGAITSAKLPN